MKTYLQIWNEIHGRDPEDDPREHPEDFDWIHNPDGTVSSVPKPMGWDDPPDEDDEDTEGEELARHFAAEIADDEHEEESWAEGYELGVSAGYDEGHYDGWKAAIQKIEELGYDLSHVRRNGTLTV